MKIGIKEFRRISGTKRVNYVRYFSTRRGSKIERIRVGEDRPSSARSSRLEMTVLREHLSQWAEWLRGVGNADDRWPEPPFPATWELAFYGSECCYFWEVGAAEEYDPEWARLHQKDGLRAFTKYPGGVRSAEGVTAVGRHLFPHPPSIEQSQRTGDE